MALVMALFLCSLIVGMLAYTQGIERERRFQSPHHHAEPAETEARRACAGLEVNGMFECVFKRVEASEEISRTEQDLTAQQRAATSALVAAIVSALTLIVTAVGVWFVKRTLDATVEAVKDTSEATASMKEQTRLMANAQRPWLDFDIRVEEFWAETGPCLWLTVKVIGDQQFPAAHLRAMANIHLMAGRPFDESERARKYILEYFKDHKAIGPTVFPRSPAELSHVIAAVPQVRGPVMLTLVVGLEYSFGQSSGVTFRDFTLTGAGQALEDERLDGSANSARVRGGMIRLHHHPERTTAV